MFLLRRSLKLQLLQFFVLLTLSQAGLAAAPAVNGADPKGKDDKSAESGAVPTYAVSGEGALLSNFIDRGLSMSNGFAMNASFLVNLGSQFKFGFWGSNISKLGNDDDNLWVKYVAEVSVDFEKSSKFIFYVNDDHYYKTAGRNGQRFGFKLDTGLLKGLVEFQNNFEATHASAYYGQLKFNKKYTAKSGVELGAGYTMQYSTTYHNYVDLLGVAYYNAFPKGRFEAGLTMPSNLTQFGSRSHLGYFVAFRLEY